MYNKFNSCISDFSHEEASEDYWYDCAVLEANKILTQFNESDWKLLLEELNKKSILWQKRVIECLGGTNNLCELKIIFKTFETKDEDLFVACVDSLRDLDLSGLTQDKKEQLLVKLNLLMEKSSPLVKKIIGDCIKKLNI